MNELSAISEIAISYALLTVGTDTKESKIMRLRCADAAREAGYTITADGIERSLNGRESTIEDVIPRSLNVSRLREYAPDTEPYPTTA